MLVIRLFRVGKKNQPIFKIVVTDKKNPPRAGRFLEMLGVYSPLTKEKKLKTERIKYWMSVGAKPSATVYNLLISEKILEGKKIPLQKKSKKAKEAPAAPAAAPQVPEALAQKETQVAEKTPIESPEIPKSKESEPPKSEGKAE